MKLCAVIMAGGKGERFWPKSRNDMPKQFLSLTGDDKTMIQKTVSRIKPLIPEENIYIVTNHSYIDLVKQQLPDIPAENILTEPMSKNTAPCIALAAAVIAARHGDAIMVVLPSDHLIRYEDMFVDTIRQASDIAVENNNLVTIGIMPTQAETGYGYIKFKPSVEKRGFVYEVEKFVEKPSLELAKEYLSSGKYLWNSGMFVWKVSSIVENFRQHLPQVHKLYGQIFDSADKPESERVLTEAYKGIDSVSIDFGVMEHADKIYTIPGNFGWDDVGSWLALERINQTNELGNVVKGDVITIDTNNSIIVGGSKLIAVVGMNDIVVVDTEDATLICAKDSTQDIKKVIENIKICNRRDVM